MQIGQKSSQFLFGRINSHSFITFEVQCSEKDEVPFPSRNGKHYKQGFMIREKEQDSGNINTEKARPKTACQYS
jgi:hypothetical protein